jgi:hypothetical protein
MKWFNRTAQGFSPGKGPITNRPERAADRCVVFAKIFATDRIADAANEYVRLPLQGNPAYSCYPGLKPWAVFFNHFMVNTDPTRTNDSSPVYE